MVWSGARSEERIAYRFIPAAGNAGYLQNVQTGRIVEPYTGMGTPSNGTTLLIIATVGLSSYTVL